MKPFLRSLLLKRNRRSKTFNRVLIVLNLLVFGLFALEALYPGHPAIRMLEFSFGTAFLFEYLARLWVAPRKLVFIFNIFSIIDVLVLVSLFAPFLVGNLALLRILRSLKILRTYYIVQLIRKESKTVAQYWGTVISVLNFIVFLGVMTAIKEGLSIDSIRRPMISIYSADETTIHTNDQRTSSIQGK